MGWRRPDASAPPRPSTTACARRSSRSPPTSPPRTATPVLPPAWMVFWSNRSTANGSPRPLPHSARRPSRREGLESSQRHFLDVVAFALLQDQIGALPGRQNVLVQIDEVDAIPDRCRDRKSVV